MPTEIIEVPMAAARVCEAIARIGYSPAAALMDIIDNSVTAGATRIQIDIERNSDKTYAQNDNVDCYRVLDNGSGMVDDALVRALQLGTPRDYPEGSLSKYGMGLKSAGLSLGSRIALISRVAGHVSRLHYVDKEVIVAEGKYVVCREAPPDSMVSCLKSFLSENESGTVVEITKCGKRNHASAQSTIKRLQEELGTRYFGFLTDEQNPISITVKCTGKPDLQIAPWDILFLREAVGGFDPDTYDGKSPCLVTNDMLYVTNIPGDSPVTLQVVLFPKDTMARNPAFSEEERKRIKQYKVGRENRGFFIYRNGRLIRWGDSLGGMVKRDLLGFRAKLSLKSAHDDALHVDVSKQHLSIPEDILEKIETLIRIPRSTHEDLWTKCDALFPKTEGGEFNVVNQDLVEEDPEDSASVPPSPEKKQRKNKLIEETDEKSQGSGEILPTPPTVTELPTFERVRYSDNVPGMVAWEAGYDPSDGTFVRINRNHSFFGAVLTPLEPNGPHRQAIEAMFWALAVADNLTRMNLNELDDTDIKKVIDRFKRLFASNLDSWASKNQNLLSNG